MQVSINLINAPVSEQSGGEAVDKWAANSPRYFSDSPANTSRFFIP